MKDNFAAALAALAAVLNEPMPPERIIGYCSILNEFDDDQLVAACGILGKSSRFFPKPCEFVDLIKTGELPGEGHEVAAAAAWGRLLAVMSDVRAVSRIASGDHRIEAGIAACGDAYSLVNGDDDIKWKRRAFIQGFCASVAEERRAIMGVPDTRRLPPPEMLMLNGGYDEDDET
jgi:hypothetical protein